MSQSDEQLKIEVESLRFEVASLKQSLNSFAQTEAALRDSEARFRSLSDASPIGIFQTDVKGHCSYTNARWQSLAGLSFEESLGEGWVKAIHPDEREAVFAHWNQCVKEGCEYEQQFRFLNPQGQICWVLARAAAIRNDLGEIVGYVGTNEDIRGIEKCCRRDFSLRL
jgi:PAS domain S-box-containing protein